MRPDSAHLLTDLLRQVSRSFYTTLRVLPRPVRTQIGLAYLLARATDTVADTEIVPLKQRLDALSGLRGKILGSASAPIDFGELARHQGSPAERVLLERIEEAIELLNDCSERDRALIREVLRTIISGQELDLIRFGGGSVDNISILGTDPELDDYTYRVAGCVGEFWTKMCRTHLFPDAPLDDATLLADGVRFGKGLQLVNILRDIPSDLRQGRCYIPRERLAAHRLEPSDLLKPDTESRFRPLYASYLDLASAHLSAGWDYTNRLPRSSVRVRLACAWPILIGIRTISRLRSQNVLDPGRRIKISRAEVRGVIFRTVALYPWPRFWQRLFAQAASA
jgi:farnesyl-diphosphate farnesyltransferase